MLLHHAVDGLQLEGHTFYQYELFRDSDSVDLLLPVQGEASVENHGVGLPCILIVDRNDKGVVVPSGFLEFEPHDEIKIKVDCAPLVHPWWQSQLLHEPILARRIKPTKVNSIKNPYISGTLLAFFFSVTHALTRT